MVQSHWTSVLPARRPGLLAAFLYGLSGLCLSWTTVPLTAKQIKRRNDSEQANIGLISALAFTVTSVPVHNDGPPDYLPDDNDVVLGLYYLLWIFASVFYIVATFLSVLSIICSSTLASDAEIMIFFRSIGLLVHTPMMLLMLGGCTVIFAVIFNVYFATPLWTFITVTGSLGLTVLLMALFGARLVQSEWDAKSASTSAGSAGAPVAEALKQQDDALES
jgi:hypothetical protein